MDANGNLVGNTTRVTNSSGTIEATENLRISAGQITNKRNVVGLELGDETVKEYVAENPRYSFDVDPETGIETMTLISYDRRYWRSYANEQYTPSTSAAGQLLANNMWLSGNTLTNSYSTIAAAQTLNSAAVPQAQIYNIGNAFRQRTTVTDGWQDSWAWVQTGGHDECYPCRWVYDYSYINTPIPYAPQPTYTPFGYCLVRVSFNLSPATCVSR